jgi:uncharacterized membrane protein YdjX (TVP38/TMEM64 family)
MRLGASVRAGGVVSVIFISLMDMSHLPTDELGPAGRTSCRGRVVNWLAEARVSRTVWVKAVVVVVGLIAVSLLWRRFDVSELYQVARGLSGGVVFLLMVILPLAGFPVSWLHVVAGMRFGFFGGGVVVAVTGVLHHVLGWMLVRALPERFFRRLAPWRRRFAGTSCRDATLLCGLLPGMPYVVQLYLLPAIGTPFPLMFGLSAALHTARALVTIYVGDTSEDLTWSRMGMIVFYYVVLLAVSLLALRRLRGSMAD